jgi:hypothetical protein
MAAKITYEGALAKCTARDVANVVVAKVLTSKDIGSEWKECRPNNDEKTKGNGAFYKDVTCSNVANGKPPVKAYYSDSACTTLTKTVEAMSGYTSGDNVCRCELYNGCKKGTTFEKYYCAGKDTATTKASVIAVGYSDSDCKTRSGTNRTLPSVTDALNPGICGIWPPLALKPEWDMSVSLSCNGVNQLAKYSAWTRMSKDVMAPKCSATDQHSSGFVDQCYCTDEIMFNEIARKSNVQVTGDVTMSVSDVATAVKDVKFKNIVKATVADAAGVSPGSIVDLSLSAAARRLEEISAEPRMLAAGSIKASYIIVIPKAQEAVVKAAVTDVTPAALSTKLTTKVTSAKLSFTATVSAKSVPAAAPATVSISTSGVIAKEGVSPSGTAVASPEGSANGSMMSQALSFLVLFAVTLVSQ